MRSKFLGIATAIMLCALFAALPLSASAETTASGTCGDNLTWVLTDDGTLTISGQGDMTNYSSSGYVPWYSYNSSITMVVIGDEVTSISDYAFRGCTDLTSVTIPESVTSVGDYVFRDCTGLTSVTIPAGVTSIGEGVFYGCSSLTSVGPIGGGYNIEFGWTDKIPGSAFYNCTDLTEVILPDGITGIGSSAFRKCSGLTEIEIPDGVTRIQSYAFMDCTGLTSITIPASVTIMVQGVFFGCSGLTSAGPIGGGYSIEFGWTDSVPDDAFYYCSALTSVTLPEGITSIGSNAFYSTGLTNVTIPETVTKCGSGSGGAFSGCSGLTSTGPIGGGYDIEFGWTVAIPNYAFYKCTGLTSVTIPDSVTSIGSYAFNGCTSLTSVEIPANTSVGNNAFGSSVSVYGYTGSYAEIYAAANGNEFISLGEVVIDEVEVSTASELAAAIKSNRTIILEDGVYSFSGSLGISNIINLTITAKNSGKAEILTSSGYYAVADVQNSYYIALDGLIMGHSGSVWCSAPVVEADYSSDIALTSCDLFGCGITGVFLYDTSDFTADDCVIRDCEEKICYIYNSNAGFTNCIISGNAYNGNDKGIDLSDEGSLSFTKCTFINNNSTALYDTTYADYITFTECVFSDNAWDGGTPQDYGVCLNGITWRVEDDTLYLGYDIELEDGSVITSELGEVLPYSNSSLPWKNSRIQA